MIKIAIIGVIAVLLALSVKQDQAGFSMLLVLASCVLILGFSLTKMQTVLKIVQGIGELLQEDAVYIQVLLKMLGITYVAEFGSALCRDAGYGAIGGQIEFYGKLMLLVVSMPIIENLVKIITEITI